MTNYRRLPLKKLNNCRDLGGFAVPGGVTKYGVFLRSELPFNMPAEDIQALKNFGVTDCMDFRGAMELQRIKNDLSDADFVTYHSIPMYGKVIAPQGQTEAAKIEMKFVSWQKTYYDMLTRFKDWTREVLTTAAQAKGVTLYNCTTGKDRTGLCTMLLLSIAGVSKADIVADYSVSMVYMKNVYATIDFGGELPEPFKLTPPEAMGDTIDALERDFGSVMDYIRACGVEESVIERIREKLVEHC